MMGSQQEVWLSHAMQASVKSGRPWQIVGFGTVIGPDDDARAKRPTGSAAPAKRRACFVTTVALPQRRRGLPFNYDNWGGYPAARARFLRSVQALGGNTVVITGDSHNAWAYNLAQDGTADGGRVRRA